MKLFIYDKFGGDRNESHELLKKAITQYCVCERRSLPVCINDRHFLKSGKNGKPYINGFSCFSVSHTKHIWGVIFDEKDCGLDMQFGRIGNLERIAEKFFAYSDAAVVKEFGFGAFFKIWTRREAYLKAIGGTVFDSTEDIWSCGSYNIVDGFTIADADLTRYAGAGLYAAICTYGKRDLEVVKL